MEYRARTMLLLPLRGPKVAKYATGRLPRIEPKTAVKAPSKVHQHSPYFKARMHEKADLADARFPDKKPIVLTVGERQRIRCWTKHAQSYIVGCKVDTGPEENDLRITHFVGVVSL